MEQITLKYNQLRQSAERLNEAVILLQKNISSTEADQANYASKEELYRGLRDSLIQRFKITTDLFWKYTKKYLEKVLQQNVELNAPAPILRQACKSKLFSEKETSHLTFAKKKWQIK